MQELGKKDLKRKAKDEILSELEKLVKKYEDGANVNGVPFSQEDEYKVELAAQVNRVERFLGNW